MQHRGESSTDLPQFKNAVSLHSIGEVTVTLYSGLIHTLKQAEIDLKQKQVILGYRFLSGDERLDFNMNRARSVVLGEVQNAWYEANGYDIPPQVMSNQEQRLREAIVAKKEAAAAEGGEKQAKEKQAKEKRVTVKSIAETGLLAGKSEDDILAEIKANFPGGKADITHVRYYRHFLVKDGQLEKLPRKPKATKADIAEAKNKTLAEAAKPAAPKAAKGSQPTKATSSKPAKARA